MNVTVMEKGNILTEHLLHTSIPMDTIVIINELLQEGLVLFQDIITHVWDVVKESLIFDLPRAERTIHKQQMEHPKRSLKILKVTAYRKVQKC